MDRRSIMLTSTTIALAMIGLYGYQTMKTQSDTNKNEVTMKSGLTYIIQQNAPDDAQKPTAGKMVSVHYTGWLDDNGNPGKKFDSSVDRAKPFQFMIGSGQVIKGWDEGVMNMKIGEKRRLIIPSHLAYGQRGIPGVIPANATLIFDVELLTVS